MTSEAYSNNDTLLFPLQIWKQPHRIKCSEQFRVNKQDTDCFEHLHEENTKLTVNVFLLLEFSYQPQVFMVFTEGRGGVTKL